MRRTALILCIFTFAFAFCSCKAVNISTADELISSSWEVTNPSKVSAELSFDIPSGKANLTVSDRNGKDIAINGVFAVDKDNLYIISEDLCKTYKFGYTVYKDRVVLTYNGADLTLNSVKEKEP